MDELERHARATVRATLTNLMQAMIGAKMKPAMVVSLVESEVAAMLDKARAEFELEKIAGEDDGLRDNDR